MYCEDIFNCAFSHHVFNISGPWSAAIKLSEIDTYDQNAKWVKGYEINYATGNVPKTYLTQRYEKSGTVKKCTAASHQVFPCQE